MISFLNVWLVECYRFGWVLIEVCLEYNFDVFFFDVDGFEFECIMWELYEKGVCFFIVLCSNLLEMVVFVYDMGVVDFVF